MASVRTRIAADFIFLFITDLLWIEQNITAMDFPGGEMPDGRCTADLKDVAYQSIT